MQVLLAPDIERILGMPGGHELHGEVTLDQLFFMRPGKFLMTGKSWDRPEDDVSSYPAVL